MVEFSDPVIRSSMSELLIHFDTPTHAIRLDTFFETSINAVKIAQSFMHEFLTADAHLEYYFLPPENGGWKTKVGIVLAGSWAFVNASVGSNFIEGLTGKTPQIYAHEFGEKIRESISVHRTDALELEYGSQIVVDVTQKLIELDDEQLCEIQITPHEYPEIYFNRASFFESCIKDSDIRAVGFSNKHEFSVQRSQFPERADVSFKAEALMTRKEIPPVRSIHTKRILVTSPNWARQDQNRRKWKGKDIDSHRDILFTVDDSDFWQVIEEKRFQFGSTDVYKVEILEESSKDVSRLRPQYSVLRVLEVNDTKFSEPTSQEERESYLKSEFNWDELCNDNENDLFSGLNGLK